MRVQSRSCVPTLIAALLLTPLTLAPDRALAQAPSIGGTSPQAAQPGGTVAVKIRGANLAGPTQIWTSFPSESTLATDVPDNGKNAAELTYQFKLPPDAPVGVHGLRVATAKGVSNLFLFVVDDLPSLAQVKPNTTAATAQVISVPSAVDGSVDSLVRNYYKFTAQAGQQLSFEILARRLGSPLDPMVRLLDLQGHELAYSDDAPGLGADAQLFHTFKDAGEYLLEVRDIRFQGGGNFYYRLRVGDFPCVAVPYPMGAKRGVAATIGFAGALVQAAQPVAINLPADFAGNWLNVGAKAAGGLSSGFASLSVSSGDESLEQEPNEDANATRVALGANLNGRFDKVGDVDRFVFTAKNGQHFLFTGITREQGSPTDRYLRLLKADGAQVAVAEDNGPSEGVIDFTFPATSV